MYRNLKPTTPQEWSVIVWTGVVILVSMSVTAFVFAGRADAPEQVAQLKSIGLWSGALAVVLFAIRR